MFDPSSAMPLYWSVLIPCPSLSGLGRAGIPSENVNDARSYAENTLKFKEITGSHFICFWN